MSSTEKTTIEIYDGDSPPWFERVIESSPDYFLDAVYSVFKKKIDQDFWEIGGQVGEFLKGVSHANSKISMDLWIDSNGKGHFGYFFKNGDLLIAPCKINLLRPLLRAATESVNGISNIKFWLEDCEIIHSSTLRTRIKSGNIFIEHYKNGEKVYSERIFDGNKYIVK